MRKINFLKSIALAVVFATLPTIISCKTENPLLPYVSELVTAIYRAETQDKTFTAYYGSAEYPLSHDGNAKKRSPRLLFKTEYTGSETEYVVCGNFGGKDFSVPFSYDGVSGKLIAVFNAEGVGERSFDVQIKHGGTTENLTFTNVVPENTLTYKKILDNFYTGQPTYIKSLTVDGKFNAEITLRVIVREEKPYWYLSVVDGCDTKAMLFDGITGELLAVKDVF
ncbi:MAG: hypothetical protein MJ072_00230 [Clostridia bacterium]|nr:hypothetical protein [Clostridia bacterium]